MQKSTPSLERTALEDIHWVLANGRIDSESRKRLQKAADTLAEKLDRPPWWKSVWAFVPAVAAILGIVAGIITVTGCFR